MNRRLALLPVGLAAGTAIAFGAGLAAGAASTHSAQPAARAAASPVLVQPALVKPFTAYGDHAVYDLVPGGNFAPRTASWTLAGDASLVNNGADAAASGDHALSLASGASATSASFPGGDVHTVRFYAENLGAANARLQVSATVDVNGVETQVPLGTVAGSSLAPTPVMTLPRSLQIELTKSDAPLRVTISSTGQNSHWLVKDVYVDPYLRCGSNC